MSTILTDIDECADNTDNCHRDARCHNTKGNYTCTCKPGYEGSGTNCKGKLYSNRFVIDGTYFVAYFWKSSLTIVTVKLVAVPHYYSFIVKPSTTFRKKLYEVCLVLLSYPNASYCKRQQIKEKQ